MGPPMQHETLFAIGFTEKGSVVLLPEFPQSAVGRAGLQEQAVYLRLAQKANHSQTAIPLDGLTLPVDQGQWFGSRQSLAAELGLNKQTLRRILEQLSAIGAISVENVERRQRYKKRPVDGTKTNPFNGTKFGPQGFGNRTDVRCLGTLVKVHGWKDFRPQVVQKSNGPKFVPQVLSTAKVKPRLSAAHRAINEQALAVLSSGGL